MNDAGIRLLIVIVPLVLTNILHMIIVKMDLMTSLKIPVWRKGFGENKTWRGLIFIPFANAIFTWLLVGIFNIDFLEGIRLGFLLGLAYALFELPNSFVKRRLGIMPGSRHKKLGILFSLLDKMDSAFGVALTFYLLGYAGLRFAVLLFVCNSLTHILFSELLFRMKVKKSF